MLKKLIIAFFCCLMFNIKAFSNIGYQSDNICKSNSLITKFYNQKPVTMVNGIIRNVFIDTISINEDYIINFNSFALPTDTLLMHIVPNILSSGNIFENNIGARWGEEGNLQSGSSTIIYDVGSVESEFYWRPHCGLVRNQAYEFMLITNDLTLPNPLSDTVFVKLYVTKKENYTPFFVSPDTIRANGNNNIKTYRLKSGNLFQLDGDSIIKTYDGDSTQQVYIGLFDDPLNGSDVNNSFIFMSYIHNVSSYATFKWNIRCEYARVEPYKVKIIAYDNDCYKPDSVDIELIFYIDNPFKIKTKIIGESENLDTSEIYKYYIDTTSATGYNWISDDAIIISGQGTDTVFVKWKKTVNGRLICVLKFDDTDCLIDLHKVVNSSTSINNQNSRILNIYPNPTSDYFYIEGIKANIDHKLILYDIQGKVIFEKIIKEKSVIDISDIEKGIYIIKLDEYILKVLKI